MAVNWNTVFIVFLIIFLGIRFNYAALYINKKSVENRIDGLEFILITLVKAGLFFLPILHLFTQIIAFADYSLPPFSSWIGAIVMPICLLLFWRRTLTLAASCLLVSRCVAAIAW
jgi:hypothetical protein